MVKRPYTNGDILRFSVITVIAFCHGCKPFDSALLENHSYSFWRPPTIVATTYRLRRRNFVTTGGSSMLGVCGRSLPDTSVTDRYHRQVAPWQSARRRQRLAGVAQEHCARRGGWPWDRGRLRCAGFFRTHDCVACLPQPPGSRMHRRGNERQMLYETQAVAARALPNIQPRISADEWLICTAVAETSSSSPPDFASTS